MSYVYPAKSSFWLVAILSISTLSGCALFAESSKSVEQEAPQQQVMEAIECPPPAVIEEEPSPVLPEALEQAEPAPVCPEPEPKPCPICPAAMVAKKLVLGEYERVTVGSPGVKYLARIDTGAATTSIHALEVTRFERDGQRWVRFKIDDPKANDSTTLERRLVRRVRIKKAEAENDHRLTVMMTLRLGRITRQVEVSLSDRADMEFPVLIGRNFLLDTAVVDVSLRNTAN